MKKVLIFSALSVLIACSSNESGSESGSSLALTFADDPSTATELEGNAIIAISEDAAGRADASMTLDKTNVEEVVEKMKSYSTSIVVVEDHTIVRITDPVDCKSSGSWHACMPLAEGYIRSSGSMKPHGDYLNNIIGTPDDQERTVYFFE